MSSKRNTFRLNSYARRRIRNALIEERGVTCEECHKTKAVLVHHIDENPRNNNQSNLKLLCRDCHRAVHKRMNNTRLTTTGPPFYKKVTA